LPNTPIAGFGADAAGVGEDGFGVPVEAELFAAFCAATLE
jgi:hypothetical protein